jgi:CHASE2 domain-containing sensor protein
VLAVALGTMALALVLNATDALDSAELETVDARFAIRGEHAVPHDMVIVAIDDQTISDLGRQFPLPRSYHGRVIDRLHNDGAKLIVYDIEFRGQSPPRQDERLLAALDRARPVVLGATATNDRGEPDFMGAPALLREVGARPASALIPPEGTVRKFPYRANGLKSIGVVSAETLARRTIAPEELGDHDIWIDYAGPSGTISEIPFSRVLRGQFPAGFFRDKVAVVGGTALVLQDRHSVPLGDEQMAGPEIQANAINTARGLAPLESLGGGWTVVFIVLLALIPPVAALRRRPLVTLAISLGALAVYLLAAQYLFHHGHVVPVAYPLFAFAVALLGTLFVEALAASFGVQGGRGRTARAASA